LPSGTAEVTVNGNGTGAIDAVECESIAKGLARISIGRTSTRITVLVDGDTLKGVAFHDIEGFTGSYWQDLQGSANVGMVDQTYKLTGTAVGFNTEHPFARTRNSFNIKVAC
jgi:hypothetical protein